ncbi:DegV family protein [Agrilactobacillus fermenti]|uniref:DegV family protein n=1 Tax=Agrilactobacillus fermenti TaxID=2586909 RepID=UPI001E596080|nr:DegV family protein [Agrilactobacillus fermenti]MCD2256548.1 DegV family protein [Agrilactobacillus fermenti]
MSTVKVVTDSSVQLTPEEIEKYQITVVPLTIEIDGQSYIDDKDITREEFMKRMAQADNLPTTSQPSVGTFIDTFDRLAVDGSPILAIHMTETISGTVNAARQAAQISRADVTVIDSQYTDRAMAFQVLEAAQMAESGASVQEIIPAIEQIKTKTELIMGVRDLTNLVKGGRISRVSGMISGLLNIKIVLTLKDGQLEVVSKGRGMKTIMKYIDKVIAKLKQVPHIKGIGISHAAGLDVAQEIEAKIKAELPQVHILIRSTDPVIATHAGPGAFALMYYTD